jgi:pimeloyl-ACP methyl ester carboxylesterase
MKFNFKKLAIAVAILGSMASLSSSATELHDLDGTSVVLVHGAWADGSSWSKVIPLLEARGLHVVSVQNSLSSLDNDVDATARAVAQQKGPVVLVGHSWGGAVITQAGAAHNVKALVYVAAFAPDVGESVNDMTKGAPPAKWMSTIQFDSAKYMTLPTSTVVSDFAQDLPLAQARLLAATQGPWFAGALDDKVTVASWHEKPSWFVVTTDDHIIPSQAQTAWAHRIGAHLVNVKSSHVVMLSHPADVANTIIDAAKTAN